MRRAITRARKPADRGTGANVLRPMRLAGLPTCVVAVGAITELQLVSIPKTAGPTASAGQAHPTLEREKQDAAEETEL